MEKVPLCVLVCVFVRWDVVMNCHVHPCFSAVWIEYDPVRLCVSRRCGLGLCCLRGAHVGDCSNTLDLGTTSTNLDALEHQIVQLPFPLLSPITVGKFPEKRVKQVWVSYTYKVCFLPTPLCSKLC